VNPWQYVTERNKANEASSKASVAKVKNPILHRKGKGKVLNSQFEQKKEADKTKAVSEVCLLEAYQCSKCTNAWSSTTAETTFRSNCLT